MDKAMRDKIQSILDGHRVMRIATLRPDGWPQVTTVGYANAGLTLYFLCGMDSQKAGNIARDNRVSLAIDDDVDEIMQITGLSMAAYAETIVDMEEGKRVMALLASRYSAQENLPIEMPAPEQVRLFRLTPTVISVLDYSQGFGHADLVACEGTTVQEIP